MDLEYLIEQANDYYIDNDIAYIYKKPTPIGVVKVSYNSKGKRINDRQRLDLLYLHLLSRYPTQEEFKTFDRYRKTFAPKQRHRVWPDVAWVLANSKEFLYYH